MKKKATTIIEDLENSNNKNEPTSELIERLDIIILSKDIPQIIY